MIPIRNARYGLPRAPRALPRRIDWSFRLGGYALTVADRHAPEQWTVLCPANDYDSYRW